jgi:hypothetical protein
MRLLRQGKEINKMKKKIISLSLAFCLMFTCSFAHSGRTDASGGHRDNKNVSGLGYYHYHCGGNPPHLHSNGICPYKTSVSSSNVTYTYYLPETPSNNISVKLPTYKICINNQEIQSSYAQYPFLNYNNITYLPLTWDYCQALGINMYFDTYTYIYSSKASDYETINVIVTDTKNKSSYTVEKKTNINLYGNFIFSSDKYPFFSFRDIIYIPLTFDVSTKLNLSTVWDNNTGLSVSKNIDYNRATYLLKPGEYYLPEGNYNITVLKGSGFLKVYDTTTNSIYAKKDIYLNSWSDKTYENLNVIPNNKTTLSNDLLLLLIEQ